MHLEETIRFHIEHARDYPLFTIWSFAGFLIYFLIAKHIRRWVWVHLIVMIIAGPFIWGIAIYQFIKQTFKWSKKRRDNSAVYQAKQDYQTWWDNEGSAMAPKENEDMEEFAHRITEIAWFNGIYCATRVDEE
jgi:hypothetical protein